jgi:hypothetical protein
VQSRPHVPILVLQRLILLRKLLNVSVQDFDLLLQPLNDLVRSLVIVSVHPRNAVVMVGTRSSSRRH